MGQKVDERPRHRPGLGLGILLILAVHNPVEIAIGDDRLEGLGRVFL